MKSFLSYKVEQEHQGLTVEEYVKQVLQYSGRKIQKLTRQKGILLNRKPVFLQKKVKTGDVIQIRVLEDQTYGVLPQEGAVDILFEDPQVIVLNKPPRMLVHPAGQTLQGTLANCLAYYFQQKGEILTIRPLHRLDRDTSGCIAFAKDAQTQFVLEQQIQLGSFKRSYYAVVQGMLEPADGTIDLPLAVHPRLPNRRVVSDQGERAVTHYKTIRGFAEMSLLELRLETGRTHQIRVHLAYLGYPVIGDTMYGKRSALINRQALHAESMIFDHPINGMPINVTAPLPPDIEKLIKVE